MLLNNKTALTCLDKVRINFHTDVRIKKRISISILDFERSIKKVHFYCSELQIKKRVDEEDLAFGHEQQRQQSEHSFVVYCGKMRSS